MNKNPKKYPAVLHIAFDKKNSSTVYALTHENKLYKSIDTGDTWNKIR